MTVAPRGVLDGTELRAVEEFHLQKRSLGPRLYQLDALRGVAAFVVLLFHLRSILHWGRPSLVLVPFFSGSQSVYFFFVLSGFVLSLPYFRGKSTGYLIYASRRFVRVYLPFAASAALSIVGFRLFLDRSPLLTAWVQQTWHGPITWSMVGSQFLMRPVEYFNTALWSLGFEMRLSLVMPLIVFALTRWNAALVLLVSLGIAFVPPPARIPFVATVQIASLFVLGATLALYETQLRSILRRMGWSAWLLLGVSVFVYLGYPVYLLPSRSGAMQFFVTRSMLMTGLGAAAIILCSLELRSFAGLLKHSLFEYLGRISFSLYLTHSIVLFALVDLLHTKVRFGVIYLLVIVASLVVAHLFCICVEEPCLQVSRRMKSVSIASSRR